ncbi:MAG: hypothetical protein QM754_04105 [Tepidisphaeraceae bacterium]
MPSPIIKIDRQNVVRRHSVGLNQFDAFNPLSVGNGEFAFTADVTGLQTFPDLYKTAVPLCTMSQWGWHTEPHGPEVEPENIRYHGVPTYGRSVPYLTQAKGQEATFHWLRHNPHRLHLGRIALDLTSATGVAAKPEDLRTIQQTLDPWQGVLTSRFEFDGQPVTVETASAGELDAVAVKIDSPLLADGRLAVRILFPYGSHTDPAAVWDRPNDHRTTANRISATRVDLDRQLDQDRYQVCVAWQGDADLVETAPHDFRLRMSAPTAGLSHSLSFVAVFSQPPVADVPTYAAAKAAGLAMWERYWTSGAAIDFAGSTDPRAHELERRVVLSQYLMKVNCAGTVPPAETGLTCNSWFGKPHLEMHWWHAVHFSLWGKLPEFERSFAWYTRIMPEAKKIAVRQGYKGVRWPKMVDADGIDSPSPVAPLLLWQQPHPIYYAELCYREKPTAETLAAWETIVDQTAEFMADFLVEIDGRYVLGPPLKGVQENNDTLNTRNPTFEITQWRMGLEMAQAWRERLGRPRLAKWDDVLERLSPAPVADGRYLYHDGLVDTYTEWSWEHPAMLGALGVLTGDRIDVVTMRRSVEEVMRVWQWDRCWGWDFPMTAMAAARSGRPDLAIDAFFIKSIKNGYGPSGHVYQRPNLPLYLPANGGLLAAIAMMAAGWDNGPDDPAPGFPKTGWVVKHEGFRKMP